MMENKTKVIVLSTHHSFLHKYEILAKPIRSVGHNKLILACPYGRCPKVTRKN